MWPDQPGRRGQPRTRARAGLTHAPYARTRAGTLSRRELQLSLMGRRDNGQFRKLKEFDGFIEAVDLDGDGEARARAGGMQPALARGF